MIRIEDLRFAYPGSPAPLLSIASLHIRPGEKVLVQGPSGSGKSTLLNLMAGIARPAQGRVIVAGEDLASKPERERRAFRINRIGFIFQDFALLDYLNATDNILLPFHINRSMRLDAAARQRAAQLLEELGIAGRAAAYPRQLSFGERQRVAIARSMIAAPPLILADEPTGSLDRASALKTLALIQQVVASKQATLVLVSHDGTLAPHFDRVVNMEAL